MAAMRAAHAAFEDHAQVRLWADIDQRFGYHWYPIRSEVLIGNPFADDDAGDRGNGLNKVLPLQVLIC